MKRHGPLDYIRVTIEFLFLFVLMIVIGIPLLIIKFVKGNFNGS